MNNKLIYILIALILILILTISAGGYYLYSTIEHKPEVQKEVVIEKEKEAAFKFEFTDLVLNITNNKGDSKFLKVSFAIKSSNEKLPEIMEKYKSDLTDSLITIVSGIDSNSLLTTPGKQTLKDSMIQEFNKLLELSDPTLKGTVKEVLFLSLVIK